MNLENYFNNNPDRLIHKWTHYFEIYEELFSRFKGKKLIFWKLAYFRGAVYKCGINILAKMYSKEED